MKLLKVQSNLDNYHLDYVQTAKNNHEKAEDMTLKWCIHHQLTQNLPDSVLLECCDLAVL